MHRDGATRGELQMGWTRPQFSILTLLAAQALVAGLLAIRLYIDPRLYWRDLWFLIGAVAYEAMFVWLLFFASSRARIVAAGFALGAVLEVSAFCLSASGDWIKFTPGTGVPQGAYPLTLPISRFLMNQGQTVGADVVLRALCIAAFLSGLLGGFASLLFWRVGPRIVKRPHV